MSWLTILHVVHVLAAGIWLGGLIFTATVVSPAFKSMEWTPAERIAVRSAVGRQYARIARFNLAVLLLTSLGIGATGLYLSPAPSFSAPASASHSGQFHYPAGLNNFIGVEITLIVLICLLSELHARFFAPRLAGAAKSGDEAQRQRALRVSLGVSMINLILSLVVAVLAI